MFGLSRKTIFLYKKDYFQHRMMVLGLFDINYSLRVTLSDTFMGKTMAFCPENPKQTKICNFYPQGDDEHPHLFYMGVTSPSPPPGEARTAND